MRQQRNTHTALPIKAQWVQAGIGSDMVSKELLRTKQLFAVNVSKAHRLLS